MLSMRPRYRSNVHRFDAGDERQRTAVAHLPCPPLSESAGDLFGAMMNHALAADPRLTTRQHAIKSAHLDDDGLRALQELLRATYAEPMEGCHRSIPLLEYAQSRDGALEFTIAEDYAAHAIFVGATAVQLDPRALDMASCYQPSGKAQASRLTGA
jgi:hypothetical protein